MRNRRSSGLFIVTFAVALALTAVAASGADGDTAALTVTVKNLRSAIPGATVQLTDEGGQSSSVTSDSSGAAVFSSLAAGTYRVEARLAGFVPWTQEGIVLAGGEEKTVEAILVLTQFSDAITVVTANRREQLLLDVAVPTTLLDEAQILDTGGQTAKDVLSEQAGSGVVVHSGGGRGHVSINGVGNAGVLVLIDGRRYLGRDGTGSFNLEDLDLSGAERIEVVKGAGSALYGTDALGGVINVITRQPEPGTRNKIELTAGSHSDFRLTDNYGHRNDRFGVGLVGTYRTFGGFDLNAEDPQTQGEPKSERFDLQGNGDVQLSDKVTGRLFLYYSQREVEDNFFAGATQIGTEIYDQQLDLTRTTISPELDFVFGSGTTLNVTLTHGKYDREETDVYPDRSEVVPLWQEWNTEAEVTFHQSFKALGEDQLLQAGYEYRHHKMDRANLLRLDGSSSEVDRDLSVGWIQQELNLTSWFTFTAGLRHDDDSEYGSKTSAKLSTVLAPSGRTRLRASWGEGFRAPRFGELFLNIPFFFVGNPNLQPETSETLTVGFTYFGPKLNASIDYFDTELDNAIGFDFGDFIPPFTYRNIPGISTREGFNTELAVNLPGGFTPSIAYSYLEAKDRSGNDIGGIATDTGFFKLLWQSPRQGLRANLRAEHRGEETPGSFDGSFTPSYTLWNLQVSKTVDWGSREIRFWARADNLFDKTDIFRRDANGDPIPGQLQVWEDGRSFHVGVNVGLGKTK